MSPDEEARLLEREAQAGDAQASAALQAHVARWAAPAPGRAWRFDEAVAVALRDLRSAREVSDEVLETLRAVAMRTAAPPVPCRTAWLRGKRSSTYGARQQSAPAAFVAAGPSEAVAVFGLGPPMSSPSDLGMAPWHAVLVRDGHYHVREEAGEVEVFQGQDWATNGDAQLDVWNPHPVQGCVGCGYPYAVPGEPQSLRAWRTAEAQALAWLTGSAPMGPARWTGARDDMVAFSARGTILP